MANTKARINLEETAMKYKSDSRKKSKAEEILNWLRNNKNENKSVYDKKLKEMKRA